MALAPRGHHPPSATCLTRSIGCRRRASRRAAPTSSATRTTRSATGSRRRSRRAPPATATTPATSSRAEAARRQRQPRLRPERQPDPGRQPQLRVGPGEPTRFDHRVRRHDQLRLRRRRHPPAGRGSRAALRLAWFAHALGVVLALAGTVFDGSSFVFSPKALGLAILQAFLFLPVVALAGALLRDAGAVGSRHGSGDPAARTAPR
jgi:hypothetical protein